MTNEQIQSIAAMTTFGYEEVKEAIRYLTPAVPDLTFEFVKNFTIEVAAKGGSVSEHAYGLWDLAGRPTIALR
ncbi:hypothetical protein D3C87_777460 [compost metagenome]